MARVKAFVDNVMVPDLLAIAPFYIDLADDRRRASATTCRWGIFDDESQDPYDRVFPRGAHLRRQPGRGRRRSTRTTSRCSRSTPTTPTTSAAASTRSTSGQEPISSPSYPPIDGGAARRQVRLDAGRALRRREPADGGRPAGEILVGYAAGRARGQGARRQHARGASAPPGKPEVLMSRPRPDRGPRAPREDQRRLRAAVGRRAARQLEGRRRRGSTPSRRCPDERRGRRRLERAARRARALHPHRGRQDRRRTRPCRRRTGTSRRATTTACAARSSRRSSARRSWTRRKPLEILRRRPHLRSLNGVRGSRD